MEGTALEEDGIREPCSEDALGQHTGLRMCHQARGWQATVPKVQTREAVNGTDPNGPFSRGRTRRTISRQHSPSALFLVYSTLLLFCNTHQLSATAQESRVSRVRSAASHTVGPRQGTEVPRADSTARESQVSRVPSAASHTVGPGQGTEKRCRGQTQQHGRAGSAGSAPLPPTQWSWIGEQRDSKGQLHPTWQDLTCYAQPEAQAAHESIHLGSSQQSPGRQPEETFPQVRVNHSPRGHSLQSGARATTLSI